MTHDGGKDSAIEELDRLTRRVVIATDSSLAVVLASAGKELETSAAGYSAPINREHLEQTLHALKRLEGTDGCEARMRCLRHTGALLYYSGSSFAAYDAASVAQKLATDCKDPELERLACELLGLVCGDTVGLRDAARSLSRALEIAVAQGDRHNEASAWVNLGVTLLHGTHYSDALDALEYGLDLGGPGFVANFGTVPQAYMALAWLHLGSFDDAIAAANGVGKGDVRSVGELVSRSVAESARARALIAQGKLDEAGMSAMRAHRYAQSSGSLRARIIAAHAQGLHDVHRGLVNEGIRMLKAALKESRLLKTLTRDALHCLLDAYDVAQEPEKALESLEELLLELMERERRNLWTDIAIPRPTKMPVHEHCDLVSSLRSRQETLRANRDEKRGERAQHGLLERIAVAAEADDRTGTHAYRVGALAALVAEEMGHGKGLVKEIELAARLHDIGKQDMPVAIMTKSEPLTKDERKVVEKHAADGVTILPSGDEFALARGVVRHHHERWDGTGYPDGLLGTDIPLAARITSVCEVFDALTHVRSHRDAFPVDAALRMVSEGSGTQFDPDVAKAFAKVIVRLGAGRFDQDDLDRFLGQESARSPFERQAGTMSIALRLRKSGRLEGGGR